MQCYDDILTSVKFCCHECPNGRAKYKKGHIGKSRNLDKTGTVFQSAAHVYQIYLLCDIVNASFDKVLHCLSKKGYFALK